MDSRYNMIPKTLLLAMAVCSASQTFALVSLDDTALSQINGADGISLQSKVDRADINAVRWQDNQTTNAKALELQTIAVTKNSAGATGVSSTLGLNVGSTNDSVHTPSLNLSIVSDPSFMTAAKLVIGTPTTGNIAGSSLAELAVESPNQTKLNLTTTGGLFSQTGSAVLTVVLDSMNVYLTKQDPTTSSQFNQLILADVRANLTASGKIYIDAKQGLVFNGTLDGPCSDINGVHACTGYNSTVKTDGAAGLQMSIMHRGDVGSGASRIYSTAKTADTATSKAGSLTSMGFSGRTVNVSMSVRGTNADNGSQSDAVGGKVNGATATGSPSVVGDRGLAIAFKGSATNQTSWQVGEAGSNGNGLRFSSFTDFNTGSDCGAAPAAGGCIFDFGNTYINLTSTSYLALPDALGTVNSNNKLLAVKSSNLASTLATQSDFAQSNLSGNDAMITMFRGMDLQVVPQRTTFYANDAMASGTASLQSWSLLTLLHNVNGNIALSADTTDVSKLGLSFATSTQGSDDVTGTTTKTTTIGLVNTGACDGTTGASTAGTRGANCNQFVGLRNIDSFMKGQGSIQLQTDKIHLDLTDFLWAVDADVAASYLPGATLGDGNKTMQWTKAALLNDRLFGLRLKIDASTASLDLIPGYDDGSRNLRPLGFEVDMLLRDNGIGSTNRYPSMLQTIDGPTNTTLGLEQISGRLAIRKGYIDVQGTAVEFGSQLVFNPNAIASEDFRVHEINMYPNGSSTNKQTFGEMAIAGGSLYSRMVITPR